jgi:hypothetical protein
MTKQLVMLALLAVGTGTLAQAEACGEHSLTGAYAYRSQGTLPDKSNAVWVGVNVFDGKGNTTVGGLNTGSVEGVILKGGPGPALPSTYTVNKDCTGTLTIQIAPGVFAHWDLVITKSGKSFFAINTDSGFVFSMQGVKQ